MKLNTSKKAVFIIGIFVLIIGIIVSICVLMPPKTKNQKSKTESFKTQDSKTENTKINNIEIENAYYNLMNSFYNNNPDFSYTIKDIDGNGVKELIVLCNTQISIYTYKDDVWQIGSHDFVTGTFRMFASEKMEYPGIFYYTVGGGCDHYGYLTLYDGNISTAKLCEYNYSADEPTWTNIHNDKKQIEEAKKLYNNNNDIKFESASTLIKNIISFSNATTDYTATIVFDEQDTAKQLVISSNKSTQTIPLNRSEEVTRTDRNIYAVDVNFDGYLDILIPDMNPARAIFYRAYIYNIKDNKFVEAPSFKELPNPALDIKNRRVLHSSSGDKMMSFGMDYYDCDKNDFISLGNISIVPKNDQYHFVEYSYKDGEESVKNEFYIPLHEYYLIPKQNPDVVPYYKVDSFWDLDSDKWDKHITTQENKISIDTVYTEKPLSLDEVKNIFEPLFNESISVEQSILNDVGNFEYEKEIAFTQNEGSYSLITDKNFQSIDDVWRYAYTTFTEDAAHREFNRKLDQTTSLPRFLEKDGKFYYNRNGHGYNPDFDFDSLKIVAQYENVVIVTIDNYLPGDDSNSPTQCIFIMQNTENGWRLANTESESYNINLDDYVQKAVFESEKQQPAINAFVNFLNGKTPAKNIEPNKAPKSNDYVYITDFSRRDLSLTGVDQFALFDLNDDGIPELITHGYEIDVFSYNTDGNIDWIYSSPAASSSEKCLLANKKIYWKLHSIGTTYEIASFDKDLNVTIETYFDGANTSASGDEIYCYNGKEITAEEFSNLKAKFLSSDFLKTADTVWYAYSANTSTSSHNVGEPQLETTEFIMVDGKMYQSYVASNVDIRYIYISREEYNMSAKWAFVPVGTKYFYSLELLGKVDEGRKE